MSNLSAEDRRLFRNAIRGTRELPPSSRVRSVVRPLAKARFTHADEQAVLRESLNPLPAQAMWVDQAGDELSFRRPPIPPLTLRKLRSGRYAVRSELDLHGLNAKESRAALSAFMAQALRLRHGCVRIVHGKGHRSGPGGPVLKHVVNGWLRQCDAVLAFGSARPHDGGSGAVYVLLQVNPRASMAPTSRCSD